MAAFVGYRPAPRADASLRAIFWLEWDLEVHARVGFRKMPAGRSSPAPLSNLAISSDARAGGASLLQLEAFDLLLGS
jgi:hypothetical protein